MGFRVFRILQTWDWVQWLGVHAVCMETKNCGQREYSKCQFTG